MVSREKTLAAAFQTSFEMPFPACYGGYWGADSRACVHSTTYGSFESWGWSRMPLLLFCCRSLVVAEGRKCGRKVSATARVRQRTENGGASGRDPDLRSGQGETQEAKPSTAVSPNPRKQGGKRRFKRSLKCRRPKRLFLPPGATHSFSQEEKEWGAHPRGGTAAKPPGFPGTPVPRDGRTPQRKNAGPVLTEELPRAPRPWRNGQKKSAAIPRANGTAAVREGAAFPGAAPGKQADSGDRGGNRGQEGFCPRGRNPACGGV